MQKRVLEFELGEITNAISNFQMDYQPKILYILVDKKINTRFVEKSNDQYLNPAPGTVVDTRLVEN
jgi:aubergine